MHQSIPRTLSLSVFIIVIVTSICILSLDSRIFAGHEAMSQTLSSLTPPTANQTLSSQRQDTPPVASAGVDQVVNESEVVVLDGTGSKDPDSEKLTYNWVQLTGPVVNLTHSNSANPVFASPQVPPGNEKSVLSFVLFVNDGKEDSKPDSVTVTVNPKLVNASLNARPLVHPTVSNATTLPISPPTLPTFLRYENSTYGVSLLYPENWEIYGGNESGSLTTVADILSPYDANGTNAEFVLRIDNLATNESTDLEKYRNEAISIYRTYKEFFPDFKLEGQTIGGNGTLSGSPAYTILGSYNDSTYGPQKVKEMGTIIGKNVYLIQYYDDMSSFNRYLPIVDKMISSLILTTPSGVQKQTTPTPADFLTYKNAAAGFKISYPSSWKKILHGKDKSVQFLPPLNGLSLSGNVGPSLEVFYDLQTFDRSLPAIASDQIDVDRKYVGKTFKLVESTPLDASSQKITFTYEDKSRVGVRTIEILKVFGDHWYSISYEANVNDFDQFLPIVQNIADSFQETR
jgi:hypothetical protein